MSKTISAFFQFIMDDPIMLGLCLAIGVLVILFIIVLLLGKKADKEEAMKDKEEELLKTQVDLKVMEENDNNSMAPLYEEVKIEAALEAVEVPVVTDNAVSLEVPSEKVEEFTIPEIGTIFRRLQDRSSNVGGNKRSHWRIERSATSR